jgi:hypothetical protein
MFDDTLHIPLRFYTAVQKQNRYKDHVNTSKFQLLTDTTHLPPFQIVVDLGVTTGTVNLVNASSGASSAISPTIYFIQFSASAYLIHDASVAITAMTEADYYLDVTAGSDHFYSEVFSVGDITDYTILEYYNKYDLGGIDYTNPSVQFKNKLIVESTLAKPEYLIEEEATEDGEGNQLLTFQRRVKLFKMWFYAPEYIVDAVSLIGLHDYVTLTTHYGMPESETGSIYDFTFTSEWIESKGLSKVTCEFRDTPIVKTTCSDPIT